MGRGIHPLALVVPGRRSLFGPPVAVEALLGGLIPALNRLACSVNRAKCEVWGPGSPVGGGLTRPSVLQPDGLAEGRSHHAEGANLPT